jgi:hypothetical protein
MPPRFDEANDRIDDLSELRFELLPTEHGFRMAGDCVDDEESLAEIGLIKTGRFYAEACEKPNVIHRR